MLSIKTEIIYEHPCEKTLVFFVPCDTVVQPYPVSHAVVAGDHAFVKKTPFPFAA